MPDTPRGLYLPRVQWYPGHIAKAQRVLKERLALVDLVIEVADARIPVSSRFIEAKRLIGAKPSTLVLAKPDLAEAHQTALWCKRLGALPVECRSGKGLSQLKRRLSDLKEQVDHKMASRGRLPRAARVMVLGLPNVGKSSLINRLVGRKKAPTGDRPGVTRAPTWIRLAGDLELLDTPGLIPPRLENPLVAFRLALVGAVSDQAYNQVEVARAVLILLANKNLGALMAYANTPEGVEPTAFGSPDGLEILALKRGWLGPEGPDPHRAARCLLADLRAGNLGPMSWEQATDHALSPLTGPH